MVYKNLFLKIFTNLTLKELIVMLTCSIASAVISVLLILESIYKAAMLATPSFSLNALSFTIHNLSDIYSYNPNDTSIYSNFIYSFVEELINSFWVILLIDTILYMVFLYPYLSRLSFGFPTNIYRVRESPSMILIYTGLSSIILVLPITIWPMMSFILATIFYIEVRSIIRYVHILIIVWLIFVFMPFISSTLYITTYRFDLSLLSSLGLSVFFYSIYMYSSIKHYTLLIEIIIGLLFVRIFSKQRWSSIKV